MQRAAGCVNCIFLMLKGFVLRFSLDILSDFVQTPLNKINKRPELSCRNDSLHPARGAALLRVDSRAGGRSGGNQRRANKKGRKSSHFRKSYLALPSVLVCFVLSLKLGAVTPAPDGSYIGDNTAKGQAALLSLTNALLKSCASSSKRATGAPHHAPSPLKSSRITG